MPEYSFIFFLDNVPLNQKEQVKIKNVKYPLPFIK